MTGRHACHVGIKRVEVCGGKCISFVGGTFVFVFSLKDVQGGEKKKYNFQINWRNILHVFNEGFQEESFRR
jgi:hypothetical protein